MEWLPIETAPNDGETRFIAANSTCVREVRRHGGLCGDPVYNEWDWPSGGEDGPAPTHWMPLPEPPR